MKKKKVIGFIGTGNMGEALIAGLLLVEVIPRLLRINAFCVWGRG